MMITAGSFPDEGPLALEPLAGTVNSLRDESQVVLFICFSMLVAAVRPSASTERLTITFHYLTGGLKGLASQKNRPCGVKNSGLCDLLGRQHRPCGANSSSSGSRPAQQDNPAIPGIRELQQQPL